MTTDLAASFEPHRRRLLGLAYRMLGSMAEVEDAVQEAYVRWHDANRASAAESECRAADAQMLSSAASPSRFK